MPSRTVRLPSDSAEMPSLTLHRAMIDQARLPYFRGAEERKRRDRLIRSRDLQEHPNGELSAHIELIGLLSVACAAPAGSAANVSAQAMVRAKLLDPFGAPSRALLISASSGELLAGALDPAAAGASLAVHHLLCPSMALL